MELELELEGNAKALGGFFVVLLVLLGLGVLGRQFTPMPPKLLTWTDWRFLAVQRQYVQQLADMRQDAGMLVELLSGKQDLYTAWRAEQIATRWTRADIVDALAPQREALVQAAQAVQDWATGRLPDTQAVQAVDNALSLLDRE